MSSHPSGERGIAAAAGMLAAGVALVGALRFGPGVESTPIVDVAPPAVPLERGEAYLVPPLAERTPAPTRVGATLPLPPEPASEARRIARGLAAGIPSAGFDREAWITQARAIAASLQPATIAALEELADTAGAGDELIATAELLRHVRAQGSRAALPEAALEALRTALDSPATPRAAAAARALAALGTEADRDRFLATLGTDAYLRGRELAAWALGASGGETVTYRLAELVRAPRDERAGDLALATLGALLAQDHPLSPGTREAARGALASALSDPREPTQRRALVAMAALDDAAAGEPLIAALTDPSRSPGLARTAASALASMDDPGVAAELARLVSDPLLDATRRGLVAETLVASPTARGAAPHARIEALGVLAAAAQRDPDPAARRRAVWGLTGTSDVLARETLAAIAGADADHGVRAAARRGLMRMAERGQDGSALVRWR